MAEVSEDLFDELDKDSRIDETNIDGELLRIPYLHAKWMRRYIQLNKDYRRQCAICAQVKIDRSNYWMGRADPSVYKERPLNRTVVKTELPEILDADPVYLEEKEKQEVLKDVTSAVEKFISSLNNRGYNLGKAADYLRWKNGG